MDCPNIGPRARYPPRNLLNAQHKKGPRESEWWIPTATYPEPPFPTIKGTCAYPAMNRLAIKHRDLRESVHILHVLHAIFETIGDVQEHTDEWLHKKATIPPADDMDKFRSELKVFVNREQWYPKANITVKKAFRCDPQVREKIDRIMEGRCIPGTNAKVRSTVMHELFGKAEFSPGALIPYQQAVEKDMERVSREMAEYMQKQQKFDEENGLLPIPSENATHLQTEL